MVTTIIMAWIACWWFPALSFSSDVWERQMGDGPRLFNSFETDGMGRIWTANNEGLACYDGQKWIWYTPENSGIRKKNVKTICVDRDNRIWIGYGLYSKGGLTSFDGNIWKQYTKETSTIPDNFVVSISVDKNNIKWIGTTRGLSSYDDKSWNNYSFSDSTFMRMVYRSMVDNNNVKWFFWGRGLYNYEGIASFDGVTWVQYNKNNCGLRDNYISSMAIDRFNRKWFAYGLGKGGGVACFDGRNWVAYTTENSGLCDDTVLSIEIDHNDKLWCGTMNGISSFDGKTWKNYQEVKVSPHEATISFREIYYIGVGQDNSKWFDTNDGLWRFREDTSTAVLEYSRPYTIQLSISPNPFNSATAISFSLPSATNARLTVYDITGRTVRTLVSGLRSAGSHSVVWDGRDDDGRAVSSGVYIARLEAGGSARSMKILLMR